MWKACSGQSGLDKKMPPSATPPIPLAIPEGRRALAEMYLDLTLAFHASTVALGEKPGETDANQAAVAVAVMLGHAQGHPMNASQLATRLKMPRTTVMDRLDKLIEIGLIQRIKTRYYLDPVRARDVPYLDDFNLILTRGFAALGPLLSKSDR
jgi:hypothetical protein